MTQGLEAAPVLAAAAAAGAGWVLAPEAPVGPVAEALAALSGPLAAAGLPLVRVRRPWDDALWPLATKGFFPFRQRSRSVLEADGMRF